MIWKKNNNIKKRRARQKYCGDAILVNIARYFLLSIKFLFTSSNFDFSIYLALKAPKIAVTTHLWLRKAKMKIVLERNSSQTKLNATNKGQVNRVAKTHFSKFDMREVTWGCNNTLWYVCVMFVNKLDASFRIQQKKEPMKESKRGI